MTKEMVTFAESCPPSDEMTYLPSRGSSILPLKDKPRDASVSFYSYCRIYDNLITDYNNCH